MKSKNIHYTNEESILIYSKNKLINIKSHYFLQKIFEHIPKKISLGIINYNKTLQQRLNTNINDYKDYSEKYSSIEIEVLPIKNKYGNFINIDYRFQKYFHIYFNNNKNEEIKRNNLIQKEKVSKINIIINHQIKTFNGLFYNCECIEFIQFKKFYRTNINNMTDMFWNCSSLKKIKFNFFKTSGINDMSYMFNECKSLEELDLSNFDTSNVTNMSGIFYGCKSLNEINLSNINTNNVEDMSYMFYECSSLESLNISNFNINNVINMNYMFSGCSSLQNINFPQFNTNNDNEVETIDMFKGCISLNGLDISNLIINNNNIK